MNVSSTPIFTNTDILWRIEDSISPHTYTTYRWAVPPFLLFQQRLTDLLATGGPVLNNIDANTPLLPVLRLSLTQFEQVYAKDGQSSQGHITIQATLLDTNHHIVGSIQLTRHAPAPSQDAVGGALALRAAIDQLASDLTAWLAQRLPIHPSQTPPRTSPREPSS
jgi:cholesterol transport system auxiliary component